MNAIVLGNGRSGKAAAKLLSLEGCHVCVLDGDDVWPEGSWDLCVTSPGVPLDHQWQKTARAAGVKVISELQLGAERYRAMGGRMLAVTGSKGKSSVVKLVADALDGVPCGNYGKPLCEVVLDAMGVIGSGELRVDSGEWRVESGEWRVESGELRVDSGELRVSVQMGSDPKNSFENVGSCRVNGSYIKRMPVAVVEVSSFQMETTELPADAFEAAAILNLQEDHLDRHGSVDVYHALKHRLLDFAVVRIVGEGEKGLTVRCAKGVGGKVEGIDLNESKGVGGKVEGIDLNEMGSDPKKSDKNDSKCRIFEGSYFDNPILKSNGDCAVALMRAAGLGDDAIRGAFLGFEALPHRMQTVGTFDGITYIDDSKATSISALVAGVTMAFSRFSRQNIVKFSNSQGSLPGSHSHSPLSTLNSQLPKVRLIAGGLPKGDDPSEAGDCLAKCVAKVYLIGQCAEAFEQAWKDIVPCEMCGDLETAVSRARRDSDEGDCILLSPGTASFDQFRSYGERGERFADIAGSKNGDILN